MKTTYLVLCAALVASPALADTSKVFGNANARVLSVEKNKQVQGKGVLPPIAELGPLQPHISSPLSSMQQGPLRPTELGPIMPMQMGPLAPRF